MIEWCAEMLHLFSFFGMQFLCQWLNWLSQDFATLLQESGFGNSLKVAARSMNPIGFDGWDCLCLGQSGGLEVLVDYFRFVNPPCLRVDIGFRFYVKNICFVLKHRFAFCRMLGIVPLKWIDARDKDGRIGLQDVSPLGAVALASFRWDSETNRKSPVFDVRFINRSSNQQVINRLYSQFNLGGYPTEDLYQVYGKMHENGHILRCGIYHKLSGPGVNEPGDLAVQSTSRAVKNWIESEWHT